VKINAVNISKTLSAGFIIKRLINIQCLFKVKLNPQLPENDNLCVQTSFWLNPL